MGILDVNPVYDGNLFDNNEHTHWTSLRLEALAQNEKQARLTVTEEEHALDFPVPEKWQTPTPVTPATVLDRGIERIEELKFDLNPIRCINETRSIRHRLVGTELTSLVVSEGLDQKDMKFGLVESALVPCCTEKYLTKNSETKHETEKAKNCLPKNKHKKEINLPRRASKRLAGIKVDPVPELQKIKRARLVTINQSCEGKMIKKKVDEHPCCLANGIVKQLDAVEGGSSTINTMDQEYFSFLPLENQDGKLDYSIDFPLAELLADPCTAFAIQTLTGVTFETYYKNSQISCDFINIKHCETLAAVEGQNIGDEKRHFISWMDPCIEFAIKTLIDSGSTIPLDTDSNSENFLQRQFSSSNAQGHCEMSIR
ncbi:hypothetical protein CR513_50001, partial [Mucuna pruriens]